MSVQSSHTLADRRVVLVISLIFGGSLGLIQSALLFLVQQSRTQGYLSSTFILLLYWVAPLIWVLGYLLIGILVGKRTGRVGQGAQAGLCAGLFAGLMVVVAQFVVAILSDRFSVNVDPGFDPSSLVGMLPGIAFLVTMSTAFMTMGVLLGAGAGFGALGGLIGQYLGPARSQLKAPSAFYWPDQMSDHAEGTLQSRQYRAVSDNVSRPTHFLLQE